MYGLKQIRERQHLTQEELSEMSGVSVRTIQRMEAGIKPGGYTLKSLSKALNIPENDLLAEEPAAAEAEESLSVDYSKIKLINLSSVLFVVLPPLNILTPLLLSHLFKQKNALSRQIISIQILWTILAPVIFMLGIFLKLGHTFTLVLIIAIVLSNLLIILVNAVAIDRKGKLRFRLNFSMI